MMVRLIFSVYREQGEKANHVCKFAGGAAAGSRCTPIIYRIAGSGCPGKSRLQFLGICVKLIAINRGACKSRLRVGCDAQTHNLIWIMPT